MFEIGRLSLTSISYSQLIALMSNVYFWRFLLCYSVSVILWCVVFFREEVSYGYSLLSIGYILFSLAGFYLFEESVSGMKIWGIVTICIGIYLISRSSLTPRYFFYFFNASSSSDTACRGVSYCSSSCTNRLPMMAPEAFWHAASKVALFEMPNPTRRGFLRFIPLMCLK